ncbi:MAG: extensin family protein [Methylobacteriaceae bacterium]|nr:extensin family protein [Methylobacteriaceae bacterium]
MADRAGLNIAFVVIAVAMGGMFRGADAREWRRPPVKIRAPPALPQRSPPADRYANWISVEPRRWPHSALALPATRTASNPIAACIGKLASMDIEAIAATPRSSPAGCIIAVPVRLVAIRMPAPARPIAVAGEPELDCSMAEKFGTFLREIVAPLAKGYLATSLAGVSTGGFYCRPVDSVPGAPMSPHAIGIAVDVMSFSFADGRRVDIGQPGPADGEAFFKAVRTAACGYFTTVLGPGSDPAHASHIHVDLKLHGANDRYRICQ